MAQPKRSVLQLDSYTGLGVGVATGATVTDLGRLTDLVVESSVTAGSGGTFDVVIEDSADGSAWGTWVAFTQTSVAALERKAPARFPMGFLRVKKTGGTGASGFAGVVNLAGVNRS